MSELGAKINETFCQNSFHTLQETCWTFQKSEYLPIMESRKEVYKCQSKLSKDFYIYRSVIQQMQNYVMLSLKLFKALLQVNQLLCHSSNVTPWISILKDYSVVCGFHTRLLRLKNVRFTNFKIRPNPLPNIYWIGCQELQPQADYKFFRFISEFIICNWLWIERRLRMSTINICCFQKRLRINFISNKIIR